MQFPNFPGVLVLVRIKVVVKLEPERQSSELRTWKTSKLVEEQAIDAKRTAVEYEQVHRETGQFGD